MPATFPVNLSIQPLSLSKDLSPLDLFAPLAATPWSIWLDSCQSTHIDARFDIMVWQPAATLTTFGTTTTIMQPQSKQVRYSQADPLTLVRDIQQQTISATSPSPLGIPFLGGALGYFAYDLGRRFEKLPEKAEQDIKVPDMAVGIYTQALIYDHKNKQFHLLCADTKRSQLTAQLQSTVKHSPKHPFSLTTSWQANMNKNSYAQKFAQVQNYLLNGDCYQINLAQRFSAQYQGDEFQAYCALRIENKAPFSAFIRLQDSAILSISPERFLQLSNGKVQSKPIKGTLPRSSDFNRDQENAKKLKNSAKDRAENVMIVDLLRNDIAKVCQPNSVVVPKLFDIESFPAVHHLVSTVEGRLSSSFDGNDLLRAAFPGGSITGAPKIRAMQIIEQLEPHRRSVYCGSIGYLSSCGTMDTNIAIRTLVAEKNINATTGTIYCWAGGGLVADSTVDNEYQETFDKVNHILPVLTRLSQHRSD